MTPILAYFHIAARVRYTWPDRGPGDSGATGTVLDVHSDPDDPDAVCVSVLWSDQDVARSYTVTPDTVDLWALLPNEGAAPDAIAERLTAADGAFAYARLTHTPGRKSLEHLKALKALAASLRDLHVAFQFLPWAEDGEQGTEAGAGDALNDWRSAAGWYIADAGAVVWDAWQREIHARRGMPDAVGYDVTTHALRTVDHALAVAHHTFDPLEDPDDA